MPRSAISTAARSCARPPILRSIAARSVVRARCSPSLAFALQDPLDRSVDLRHRDLAGLDGSLDAPRTPASSSGECSTKSDAGLDRHHRRLLRRKLLRDGVHRHRVGEDEAVELQLVAQEPRQDRPAQRRWNARRRDRAPAGRCAMDMTASTPAAMAAGRAAAQSGRGALRGCSMIGRPRWVSTVVSPWPGKCLAVASIPPAWMPLMYACAISETRLDVLAERADVDDRVARVVVDVDDGVEVHENADAPPLAGGDLAPRGTPAAGRASRQWSSRAAAAWRRSGCSRRPPRSRPSSAAGWPPPAAGG